MAGRGANRLPRLGLNSRYLNPRQRRRLVFVYATTAGGGFQLDVLADSMPAGIEAFWNMLVSKPAICKGPVAADRCGLPCT